MVVIAVFMIMIVVALLRSEDWRIKMPAMARSARYWNARVLQLANVVRVDVSHHFVHEPRRGLLRLRVVGIIQPRLSVRPDVLGIGGVAGAAFGAESSRPAVHHFVHLLSRHRLRKHFEVGRRGFVVMMMLLGRRLLRCGGLGNSGDGKQC